jgi:hypothetical protein
MNRLHQLLVLVLVVLKLLLTQPSTADPHNQPSALDKLHALLPEQPLYPRDVVRKAFKDLKTDFILNASFTFYLDPRTVLHAMSSVQSKLALAMSIYSRYRKSYRVVGPDYSQKIFLKHLAYLSENYEEM